MKTNKPNIVDPLAAASPKWLVPHNHPDVFKRQALGVRFRWPGILGWVVLAAGFVLAILLNWFWVPAVPFIFLVFWSGILTNKGKPLRGGVLLMVALLGANVMVIAAAIVAALLLSQGSPAG